MNQLTLLEGQVQNLKDSEADKVNQILELKKEKMEEATQNKTLIHKMENQANAQEREINLLERQRKNLKTKLDNYKHRTQVIVGSI